MKSHHFIKQVEHDRLQKAIQEAEQGNTGDIVIYISHHRVADAYSAAEKVFRDLGLSKTAEHLSLLFFIAPKSRTFAVIGSQPIHEKVGDLYWQELVDLLSAHFKEGRYTDGLIAAVNSAGNKLKIHFPGDSSASPRGLDIVEE